MARTALGSDAVRAALRSGRYWRELHVGAPLEGVTVVGFIDLLYVEGDELVVVDYKTDSISGPAAAAEAAARYRPQAATYALALEATLPQRIARCVFVFTRSPAAIEVSISGSDLTNAKAEVQTALRHAVAVPEPSPTPPGPPSPCWCGSTPRQPPPTRLDALLRKVGGPAPTGGPGLVAI